MRDVVFLGALGLALFGAAAAPRALLHDAPDVVVRPVAACVHGAALVPCSDVDEDGLSDDDEAVFGTDPARADSDGDGLDDGFEIFAMSGATSGALDAAAHDGRDDL